MKSNITPFWATPIADYVNPELAQELKQYVLKQDAQGIESGVAEFIKHNLTESKFDFFHSNDCFTLAKPEFHTYQPTKTRFLVRMY